MIAFDCPCGRKLRALDSGAGLAMACPSCGARAVVPVPDRVDLGITIAPPALLDDRPRPARSDRRPIGHRPGGLFRAVLGVLGSCLLAFVLYAAERAQRADGPPPAIPRRDFGRRALDGHGFDPAGGRPEAEAIEEAQRIEAERAAEAVEEAERAKLEDRERLLREASAILAKEQPRARISRSEVVGGKVVFLAADEPDGSDVTYVVEHGYAKGYFTDARYLWETEEPAALAMTWADRFTGGDHRVVSAERSDFPPSLSAVVVDRRTGRRSRFRLVDFNPSGTANFDMQPIDP